MTRSVYNKEKQTVEFAKGMILLHNHPSGILEPSAEDKRVTEKLIKSGEILDIPIYDHLIITSNGYFSFKEQGLI